MRVGIITFQHVLNFGAVLQAYALCETIKRLGHDVHLINYRPSILFEPYRIHSRRPWIIAPQLIRRWRYHEFFRRFIPLTKKTWRNSEDILRDPPAGDAFICGSDQIWNVGILRGLDESFFLSFTPKEARKIAYAGSFGGTAIPEPYRERASQLFTQFDHLSVRETFGQSQIAELTGKQSKRVLDPALLLAADDYQHLAVPPPCDKPYIIAYTVDRNDMFPRFASLIARALGLPIVSVAPFRLPGIERCYPNIGPRQWLGWMKQATFVCTNSFHGIAFSLLFHRDFASVPLVNSRKSQNRINDLLHQFQLFDRLVEEPGDLKVGTKALEDIDFSTVDSLLCHERNKSLSFLEFALS